MKGIGLRFAKADAVARARAELVTEGRRGMYGCFRSRCLGPGGDSDGELGMSVPAICSSYQPSSDGPYANCTVCDHDKECHQP